MEEEPSDLTSHIEYTICAMSATPDIHFRYPSDTCHIGSIFEPRGKSEQKVDERVTEPGRRAALAFNMFVRLDSCRPFLTH